MDVPEFARAPRKLSIVLTALPTARQSNRVQRVAQWLQSCKWGCFELGIPQT